MKAGVQGLKETAPFLDCVEGKIGGKTLPRRKV